MTCFLVLFSYQILNFIFTFKEPQELPNMNIHYMRLGFLFLAPCHIVTHTNFGLFVFQEQLIIHSVINFQ